MPAVRRIGQLEPYPWASAPVAQWTERRPSKPRVAGSNPAGGAASSISGAFVDDRSGYVGPIGLLDKLTNARDYVRKRRGPDSYFQYKRKREGEREDALEGRERARDDSERERGEAKRGREYKERYAADRESDIAEERTERAEENEPDP
jgi:hypothetical protein